MKKHAITATLWTVLVTALLLGVSGCPPRIDDRAAARLDGARAQLEAERYGRGIDMLGAIIAEKPTGPAAAEAHYLRGLCYRRMMPPDEQAALADIKASLELSKDQSLTTLAQVAMGHSYFEQDTPTGYNAAIEPFQAALEHLPPHEEPTDAVLYRVGVSLQCVGRFSEADPYFARCMHSFEDSEMAAAAARRIHARSFQLQTHAFSEPDRAIRQASELRRRGWEADWRTVRRGDKLLRVVRVGDYRTYGDAQQALAEMRRVVSDAIIVAEAAGKQD